MTPGVRADFASFLNRYESAPLHLSATADRRFLDGFAIHRNNVHSAPVEALRQTFPVVERLVGPEYFTALCRLFMTHHPPHSAVFHKYGAQLADFIGAFPPLASLQYLADIARLEWARLCAFHAADTAPVEIDATDMAGLELALSQPLDWHPSATLLCSAHPLFSLWKSQTSTLAAPSKANWQCENVLVWRQGLALRTEPITTITCHVLNILKSGTCLSDRLPVQNDQYEALMHAFATLLHWQVLRPAQHLL